MRSGCEFSEIVAQPLNRVGEDQIHLGVYGPVLIDIRVDTLKPGLVNLIDRGAIAGEHMHAGGEDMGFELFRSSTFSIRGFIFPKSARVPVKKRIFFGCSSMFLFTRNVLLFHVRPAQLSVLRNRA